MNGTFATIMLVLLMAGAVCFAVAYFLGGR
jgi:hypothetical protein